MEIKVGILNVNREVVIESTATAAEVEKDFAKAVKDGGVFALTDERGRRVLIPAEQIGYLDIGQENVRHVGFGSV
ncbi:DUF3107 domain-containing protein [Microlunatus ginsengisoli]|uniref:DUF3107 domain-containing protein n=1 Tax=Microlunatus ginsengisoli TaxID=363863 RepID=A0ABP6ZY34_9ACTN